MIFCISRLVLALRPVKHYLHQPLSNADTGCREEGTRPLNSLYFDGVIGFDAHLFTHAKLDRVGTDRSTPRVLRYEFRDEPRDVGGIHPEPHVREGGRNTFAVFGSLDAIRANRAGIVVGRGQLNVLR